MADIELVIKIPKKDFEFIKQSEGARYSQAIIEAVVNGTPLPKGHGRLIDADALDKDCESSEYHEVITSWLDLAPTIIETDRTESDTEVKEEYRSCMTCKYLEEPIIDSECTYCDSSYNHWKLSEK